VSANSSDSSDGARPDRGALYIKWGNQHDKLLRRSIESLQAFHPELPYRVRELPQTATLLDKSAMFDLTPFDKTLYLDADTIVMDRLDFGFDQASRHHLACCICECPWARRYAGISGETIEYNTGVIFFARQAKPTFDAWKTLAHVINSSVLLKVSDQVHAMPLNDQASFAAAIDRQKFAPFVLPINWNLRPRWHRTFFGPIKVWHDYDPPPPMLLEWNEGQGGEQKIIECATLT
jgi:hypothetical protein